jgi:hypothetical protein
MSYRLHIDIPLGHDEGKAISTATKFLRWFVTDDPAIEKFKSLLPEVDEVNIRLGNDEDRQKSNYLLKNENGHVSNKKIKVDIR